MKINVLVVVLILSVVLVMVACGDFMEASRDEWQNKV